MVRIAAGVLILLVGPRPGLAQEAPVPRVHAGAHIPALARWPSAGARVEIRRSARESFEVTLDWRGNIENGDVIGGPDPRAIYALSYKRRLPDARHPSVSWFVTVGALGYYKPAGSPEVLRHSADGRPLARPIDRPRTWLPPILPLVGAGIERRLGGRLGLHGSLQLLPTNFLWHLHNSRVGPQAHLGIFVPLARR